MREKLPISPEARNRLLSLALKAREENLKVRRAFEALEITVDPFNLVMQVDYSSETIVRLITQNHFFI